jgi:hypothetical protein
MPRQNIPLQAFNRGLVSPLALARTDVQRTKLSAETMVNWVARTQGAMSLRPGLGYLGSSRDDLSAAWIDFVAATDDTALLEITDGVMRVWIGDAPMARGSVSTAVATGDFASGTGWSEANSGGADCSFGSGLTLNVVNRGGVAICYQQVSVAGGDAGQEHALRIAVTRGPVTFKCGSAQGASDHVDATLRTGTHSLAFTPAGDFYVQFESEAQVDRLVASIAVEAAGTVEIAAPWAAGDLAMLRWSQSADVVFVACEGVRPVRIERRGSGRSWSIVDFSPDNGPYRGKTSEVRLKVAQTYGNTTLTADRAFFTQDHVGTLFRLFHSGMKATFKLARDDIYTEPFLVSGISSAGRDGPGGSDRAWSYTTTGTWSGTITVERSFVDAEFGYVPAISATGDFDPDFTTNQTGVAVDDGEDNVDYYYRLGFQPGEYTSGAATIALDYPSDGAYGVCRVTGYTSATEVSVEVLQDFRDTIYTADWVEGSWSPASGYPSAAAFFNGRLWWAGGASLYGSVSDDFENFDPLVEGDSAPINRTIGEGPVDTINFILPIQRLILGTASGELSVRSTSFDEPITAANLSQKLCSSQGSATAPAVRIDNRGIFVQRSGQRVFELSYQVDNNDHAAVELTQLVPDLAAGTSIVALAGQRQPDTRIHFVLADGRVAVLTYQPADQLLCWAHLQTDGFVEKVVVLPGAEEDQVYYHVRRTVNGSTVRTLEKWAKASECVGGTLNKQADCFGVYQGSPTMAPTGFAHLEGKSVVIWADGAFIGAGTVSGGALALEEPAGNVVAGLGYSATYKSTKLDYASGAGTALTQRKRVNYCGLVLADTHHEGLEIGGDFTTMDGLPQVIGEANVAAGTIHDALDIDATNVPGIYDTDSRLCLRATAPKPVTVLGAVISVETNDRV